MRLTIQSPVASEGEKFSPQPEKWGAGRQLRRLRQALMQRRISDQIIRKPLHETCASVRPNARVQVPNESSCCDPAIPLGGFSPETFHQVSGLFAVDLGTPSFLVNDRGVEMAARADCQVCDRQTRPGMEQPQSSKFG